ncbi:MAG: hypothetical protein B1H03_00705 [Planctomycetales bacterium 4484_113]|nr:MAG: hypothetical protein B1H03_00705 [Planctomycetales bacterium 4484_113]
MNADEFQQQKDWLASAEEEFEKDASIRLEDPILSEETRYYGMHIRMLKRILKEIELAHHLEEYAQEAGLTRLFYIFRDLVIALEQESSYGHLKFIKELKEVLTNNDCGRLTDD